MRKYLLIIVSSLILFSCLDEKKQGERILRHYIDSKIDLIKNYWKESSVALWNATVSGNDSDYKKIVDLDFDFVRSNRSISEKFYPDRFSYFSQNIFTNEQDFQMLRNLKYSGLIADTLLNRQLNVLYQAFMGSQIESERYKEIVTREVKLWHGFPVSQVVVHGKTYTSSKIYSISKNSNDLTFINEIAEIFRQKAQLLAPEIVRMVKDRNDFASHFGYADYYHLALETQDQTPEEIKSLLDEIEFKTRNQFFEAKKVIDKMLSRRFGVKTSQLLPWCYNDERTSYLSNKFLPQMDSLYRNVDPIKTTAKFFEEIGLPIQDVIDNSDLKNTPQNQGITSMINVDFKNDIRLIASIENNSYDGMLRMLHLGGHASHYKNISDDVPYLLKTPNSVLSEGVSHYFENLASNYSWLKEEIKIKESNQKECLLIFKHLRQVDGLFRCRVFLVNAEFEREIYRNPDQNLDSLWSTLNLKYLGFKFPEKKNAFYWANNKFATRLSCSIHNLVLADVFAAQLQHAIKKRVFKQTNESYANNKAIGQYLISNLYSYGNILSWEKIIEKATGEPLNPTYFVNQLLDDENI